MTAPRRDNGGASGDGYRHSRSRYRTRLRRSGPGLAQKFPANIDISARRYRIAPLRKSPDERERNLVRGLPAQGRPWAILKGGARRRSVGRSVGALTLYRAAEGRSSSRFSPVGDERRAGDARERRGPGGEEGGKDGGLLGSNQTWKWLPVLTRIHCELPFRSGGTSGRLRLTSLYRAPRSLSLSVSRFCRPSPLSLSLFLCRHPSHPYLVPFIPTTAS